MEIDDIIEVCIAQIFFHGSHTNPRDEALSNVPEVVNVVAEVV